LALVGRNRRRIHQPVHSFRWPQGIFAELVSHFVKFEASGENLVGSINRVFREILASPIVDRKVVLLRNFHVLHEREIGTEFKDLFSTHYTPVLASLGMTKDLDIAQPSFLVFLDVFVEAIQLAASRKDNLFILFSRLCLNQCRQRNDRLIVCVRNKTFGLVIGLIIRYVPVIVFVLLLAL
jgi:hypothetical protein